MTGADEKGDSVKWSGLDVLIVNGCGPEGFDFRTSDGPQGLGGSELELLQIAEELALRGHRVGVANGVKREYEDRGVLFVPPSRVVALWPQKALLVARMTPLPPGTPVFPPRVVVRATDVAGPHYDVHRELLTSGRGALVGVSNWQVSSSGPHGRGFLSARERIVIPPILAPMGSKKVKKVPGLFVFASAPMKGRAATIEAWKAIRKKYGPSVMKDAKLVLVSPGFHDYYGDKSLALLPEDRAAGIVDKGCVPLEEYRSIIASAEGVFHVSVMAETFFNVIALAERARTRTHVLFRTGRGGAEEAVVNHSLFSEDEEAFFENWLTAWQNPKRRDEWLTPPDKIVDRSAKKLGDAWESALHLDREAGEATTEVFAPALPQQSVEMTFAADPTLQPNQESLGPFFGDFLSMLRSSISPGGSEFGLGVSLFGLATSVRASNIVEVGRFKGFSTLALAAALKLQDIGWCDPKMGQDRPDVDYNQLLAPRDRRIISIDPFPTQEAEDLLTRAGLRQYVQTIDRPSDRVDIKGPIDLLFIDGSHQKGDIQKDISRLVPWVRPGGYFVMHDYYGWWRDGKNGSPVAEVIREELVEFDQLLIDTGMASLVVFRKSKRHTESVDLPVRAERVPPRADGRPTVGLVMIAKNDEASTVIARAIVSIIRQVDAVTVVCDASQKLAEVAKHIGADVHIRASPKVDWERGLGVIAQARNEAIRIAEPKTDYIMMLDPDDYYEGEIPMELKEDVYQIDIWDGQLRYPRIQMFKTGKGYLYTDIRHETLKFQGSVGFAPGLRYCRGHSNYGYQDQDPPAVKFMKHARDLEIQVLMHPDDARAAFYLARSYHDAGQKEKAIDAYEKRIKMVNGWDEERYYSAFQIGRILREQGKDPTSALIRAYEMRPYRAEAIVELAQWHRDEKVKNYAIAYAFAKEAEGLAPPNDALFVNMNLYYFDALAEAAICAYWAGKKEEALTRFEKLVEKMPPDRKKWAYDMVDMCRRELGMRSK